jgi:hypothetical protein
VDRPFLFVILDKSLNLPLFMGRIVDPSGERTLTSNDYLPRLLPEISHGEEFVTVPIVIQEFPDNVNCSEMGYDEMKVPFVSFPCNGHDTFPIRDSMQRRQELNEKRFQRSTTDDDEP